MKTVSLSAAQGIDIDVVLNSNAIGCGLSPVFQDHLDQKGVSEQPFTCNDVASNYRVITLSTCLLSPAVMIFKETVLEYFKQK